MVKSTDLRIGNYVRDIVSNELMIVDEIGKNIGATLIDRDKYPLPDGWQVGYVPITPELLDCIGFKKCKFHIKGEDDLILRYGHFEFNLDYNELRFDASAVRVDYLHELQNLYFALTKKELPINIPQAA